MPGVRAFMAGKSRIIEMVVHKTEDISSVFDREEVQEFWLEKMRAAMIKNGIDKEEYLKMYQKNI